jgi:hypothetical protein
VKNDCFWLKNSEKYLVLGKIQELSDISLNKQKTYSFDEKLIFK